MTALHSAALLAAPAAGTSISTGEQLPLAGAALAPANVAFDSDFLSGQGQKVDLSAFSNGNPMVAGSYRVDIYVNGRWQGRRDLQFKAGVDGVVGACMGLPMLEELGVDTTTLQPGAPTLGKQDVPADQACVPVQQRMQDASASYDGANLRYDLSIPQAFLRHEARGYVNPTLWDRGITAAFIGYSFNAMESDIRVPGGQRDRLA
ncbi:FimD/PapC N-terminal domain-containing protein [Stenotrophomonas pigmentata]|uniref:FimD/PapC N-terminal domain-containing protein n=1 Tax=Stenotrophomonas pigmentata TaxID=3055080 RepID=UPI0026EA8B89|nr:FimD/PapC N-terminal domain-containing protein [Stenotrophomonas sp. 610A2]